jgi:hypothetical protein
LKSLSVRRKVDGPLQYLWLRNLSVRRTVDHYLWLRNLSVRRKVDHYLWLRNLSVRRKVDHYLWLRNLSVRRKVDTTINRFRNSQKTKPKKYTLYLGRRRM